MSFSKRSANKRGKQKNKYWSQDFKISYYYNIPPFFQEGSRGGGLIEEGRHVLFWKLKYDTYEGVCKTFFD